MNQTNLMWSSTNIMGIYLGTWEFSSSINSIMANNRQKDYNGLESTTYLHLQLHLNIKA